MERPNLRPLPNGGVPNLMGISGGQAIYSKKAGRNDPFKNATDSVFH
jgi:hypothetical protein